MELTELADRKGKKKKHEIYSILPLISLHPALEGLALSYHTYPQPTRSLVFLLNFVSTREKENHSLRRAREPSGAAAHAHRDSLSLRQTFVPLQCSILTRLTCEVRAALSLLSAYTQEV